MQVSFSPKQQQIIAQALTGLAVLVLASLSFLVFWAILRFLTAFSGVLMPVATAGILCLLLRPLEQSLRKKTGWSRRLTASLTLLGFSLPLLIFLFSFGGLLISQLIQFLQALPELWGQVQNWISEKLPALAEAMEDLSSQREMQDWVASGTEPLVQLARGGLQGIQAVIQTSASLLGWLVLPVYLFFFLYAPPFALSQFEQFLPFLRKDLRKDILFLMEQFVQIVVVFFRGQLTIAFLQGLIMAVGYSIAGLRYGFLLGLVFGLINIIPYLGNLVGMAVAFPLAWFQPDGGPGVLLGVVVALIVAQSVESYYLTPKIMGKQTGLHPMAVIFAMFFWGRVFQGIFGLMLAVPLTAFLVVFWRLAKEKYLQSLASDPET